MSLFEKLFGCKHRVTTWIDCDECVVDKEPHAFLVCAKCGEDIDD